MNKFLRTVFVPLAVILGLALSLSGCGSAGTLPASATQAVPTSAGTPTQTLPPPTLTPFSTPTRTLPPPTPTLGTPVPQALPTPESYPLWWMLPTPASQAFLEVTKTLDLPYTSERFLDVYSPVSAGDWPVVVIFHGGGDIKELFADLAAAIANNGAVVFVPTRDSGAPKPGARMELTGVEDAACSIRFARAHASEYGGKDTRLVLVGHSEGAMQGALMMLAGDDFHGDCLTQAGSAVPDAFLGLDGGYDPIPFIPGEVLETQPEDCLRLDPFTYIGRVPKRADIRFLLFVGTFPTAQRHSQAFRDALQAAGYSVLLVQIPGVDHNGFMRPLPETIDAVFTMLGP
jgi:acetyl esterase/lipase/predicted small lipoprotein YifL